MKLLNILNGDSALHIFNVAKLPGDTLVWRETLSEDPVRARSEDDFFKLRSEWISEAYHADAAAYQTNVISEFNKLKSFIQFASKAWEAYLSADPKKIEDIIQEDPGHLDKLPAAFAAHLQRFPDKKSGLNRIEESLVL